MKKRYMTPIMETVKTAAPSIMAGSAAHFDEMGGGEATLSSEEFNTSSDVVLGREYEW